VHFPVTVTRPVGKGAENEVGRVDPKKFDAEYPKNIATGHSEKCGSKRTNKETNNKRALYVKWQLEVCAAKLKVMSNQATNTLLTICVYVMLSSKYINDLSFIFIV